MFRNIISKIARLLRELFWIMMSAIVVAAGIYVLGVATLVCLPIIIMCWFASLWFEKKEKKEGYYERRDRLAKRYATPRS